MAKLAIKGHATRGKEVIELLEMMGGKQFESYLGNDISWCYTIINGEIDWDYPSDKYKVFTLEEFLKEFPYKVGEKVLIKPYVGARQICEMRWDSNDNCIKYGIGVGEWFNVSQIQSYKEETMEETIIDTIKESKDRYRLSINYQYEIEVDEGEYYIVRRKPQYPKTYEECCDILYIEMNRIIEYDDCLGYRDITQYDINLLTQLRCFHKLLICRDAYWKIAGDQMGLGKPWEPDWLNTEQDKFVLYTHDNVICLNCFVLGHNVLAFPTEEMRDAFYENFKDLIEDCKELL